MKADLNMSKEKSNSASSWNSIKKSEQDKDESTRLKPYKVIMVFKEAEVDIRGAWVFAT
jgi:hypothetical protein